MHFLKSQISRSLFRSLKGSTERRVVERSCQSSWFKTWTWLHYNEAKDSVHCHLCLKTVKFKHISVNPGDDDTAFVSLLACCRLGVIFFALIA